MTVAQERTLVHPVVAPVGDRFRYLDHYVYDALLEAIVQGRLAPGTRLGSTISQTSSRSVGLPSATHSGASPAKGWSIAAAVGGSPLSHSRARSWPSCTRSG